MLVSPPPVAERLPQAEELTPCQMGPGCQGIGNPRTCGNLVTHDKCVMEGRGEKLYGAML